VHGNDLKSTRIEQADGTTKIKIREGNQKKVLQEIIATNEGFKQCFNIKYKNTI